MERLGQRFPALSAAYRSAVDLFDGRPVLIFNSSFSAYAWLISLASKGELVLECPCSPDATAPGPKAVLQPSRLFPQPANRFSGCSTCRRRKVKCGEEKPVCRRCSSLRLNCEWGVPVKRGRSTQIRNLEPAPIASESYPTCPAPKVEELVDFQPDVFFSSLSPVSWAGDILPLDAPQLPTFYPPATIASPIYPSLNIDNIACANSLTLNSLDRQYFQYFPSSSLVYYYMKGWKWSSFWLVCSRALRSPWSSF